MEFFNDNSDIKEVKTKELQTKELETKEPAVKKTKKFNALDEKGKTYEIVMELDTTSIKFETEITEGILTKKYSSILSFDKLKENKIFNIQDTIVEIYEQLEVYIDKTPVSCEIKENNIIIKLTTNTKKFSEIIFELKQKEIDQKEVINILVEKISISEEKNKNVISTNNNLGSKVDLLESRIKDLESKNKKLESKNNNLEANTYSMQSNINSLNSK